MKATLFVPCYMDALYPNVARSVVQVLEGLGVDLDFAHQAVCCGQPPFNAGCWDEARMILSPILKLLEASDAVVIPSGSCGAMLSRFSVELFHGEPEESLAKAVAAKTHEFASYLVDILGVSHVGARFPHRVAYHDGCHGLRELGVKKAPRVLLEAVEGLELIELQDGEACCGFGGMFATKFPAISVAMGETKCRAATETGADFLVSGDTSCLMHIQGLASRSALPWKTMHLAEILASR